MRDEETRIPHLIAACGCAIMLGFVAGVVMCLICAML